MEGTADVRTGDWPCQRCGILCFSWRKSCYNCQTPEGNRGEYYAEGAFRRKNSAYSTVSTTSSSSHLNSGRSSLQLRYPNPPQICSSPPQSRLQRKPRVSSQKPSQPGPKVPGFDISRLEVKVKKCKVDLEKLGKEVKSLDSELQKLKRQRDSGTATQGVGKTLHEAGISIEKDLRVKDATGSKEQELIGKDLSDLKDLISKQKDLLVKDSTKLKDLIGMESTYIKDLVVKNITGLKDPDSKDSTDARGPIKEDSKDLVDEDSQDPGSEEEQE